MKHGRLITQWAKLPDDTKVWFKSKVVTEWDLVYPSWDENFDYVLNNKWSDLAKQKIDNPDLVIEYCKDGIDWDIVGFPNWYSDIEYRIKEEPKWYDNITKPVMCWVSDMRKVERVQVRLINEHKPRTGAFHDTHNIGWHYATPVTKEDLLGEQIDDE